MRKKEYLFLKYCIILLFLLLSLVFMQSCFDPIITEGEMLQISDISAPVISLISPVDGSYYSGMILVKGKVSDKANDKGDTGSISLLNYEIKDSFGNILNGNITCDKSGNFSSSLSLEGVKGNITFTLTAFDWNNNKCIKTVTLNRGNFIATPDNQKVILSWNDIPHAESYNLIYANEWNGSSQLNGVEIENVVSPFSFNKYILKPGERIENGRRYYFQLKGIFKEGISNFSGVVSAIPISPFSLYPCVKGEYKKIIIEWYPVSGEDRYIIEKATSKHGFYNTIPGEIKGNRYEDEDVEIGQKYYYKVLPASQPQIASFSASGECSPFPPFGSLVEKCNTFAAKDIFITDEYAYVADNEEGLKIIDISNPEHLFIKGECDTPGKASGIYVEGDYAYVADDNDGLVIIGVDTPSNPHIIESVDTDGFAYDVCIKGDYAYIADDNDGLVIISIDPPSNSQIVSSFDTTGSANGIDINDQYVYLADGDNGLVIVDITDPYSPDLAGHINTQNANDVKVQGNYAYIADDVSGLRIINITDPKSLQEVEKSPLDTNAAKKVAISDNGIYAYLADDTDGLKIINIFNPENPVLVTSYKDAANSDTKSLGVAVNGEFAFIAYGNSGIHAVNIVEPGSLEEATTYTATITNALDVCVSGNLAIVANDTSGLEIFDITNPGIPAWKNTFYSENSFPNNHINGVKIVGDYAFITGDGIGLYVICIADSCLSNPERSLYAGALVMPPGQHIPDYTTGLTIRGDLAYLTYIDGSSSGLMVIDISDVYFITDELECLNKDNLYGGLHEARGIALKDNLAYICDGNYGLHIVNIYNAYNIFYVNDYNDATQDEALDIDFYTTNEQKKYAFIADNNCVQSIEINNPAAPVLKNTYTTPKEDSTAKDINICADYAYIADGNGGLQIMYIADPDSPLFAGAYPAQSEEISIDAEKVTVCGEYAYVAAGESGLIILDLFPYNN